MEERRLETKQKFHWAWVILAICFVDLFINYSVRLGYGVVLPEMIRTLGFGRTAGGSIYNSYLFAYIAVSPFTGYLTDRIGARRVITSCLLILGFAVFLLGTVHTLWSACIIYGFVGLGAAGLWGPVITLVQRWFAFHRRGFALGILGTGYGLGFATMGAVFPWIVANFNWRYAWFFLGGSALVMVAANGLEALPGKMPSPRPGSSVTSRKSPRVGIASRQAPSYRPPGPLPSYTRTASTLSRSQRRRASGTW